MAVAPKEGAMSTIFARGKKAVADVKAEFDTCKKGDCEGASVSVKLHKVPPEVVTKIGPVNFKCMKCVAGTAGKQRIGTQLIMKRISNL